MVNIFNSTTIEVTNLLTCGLTKTNPSINLNVVTTLYIYPPTVGMSADL